MFSSPKNRSSTNSHAAAAAASSASAAAAAAVDNGNSRSRERSTVETSHCEQTEQEIEEDAAVSHHDDHDMSNEESSSSSSSSSSSLASSSLNETEESDQVPPLPEGQQSQRSVTFASEDHLLLLSASSSSSSPLHVAAAATTASMKHRRTSSAPAKATTVTTAAAAAAATAAAASVGGPSHRRTSSGSVDVETGLRRPGLRRETSIRKSIVPDMETGREGGRAAQAVLRREYSSRPCSKGDRFALNVKRYFALDPNRVRSNSHEAESSQEFTLGRDASEPFSSLHDRLKASQKSIIDEHHEDEVETVEPNEPQRQYRLQSVQAVSKTQSPFMRWLGFRKGNVSIYDDPHGNTCAFCGISPNAMVMTYLHWAFRQSFAFVFLSAALVFLTLTFLFAIPIYGIARKHPTCIGGVLPDDEDYNGPQGGTFIDAWELSWTTFTTVGYGVVYSGISSTEPDVRKCTGITMIVTIEAFVGVLFASMCGAIMFSKVARIQSYAQVIFSDPVVIRYGSGVAIEDPEDNNAEDSSVSSCEQPDKIPCPVLEFRLNNRLHSIAGGEIIDATLNIVASIDAIQASPTLKKSTMRRRRGKKKKGMRRRHHAQKLSDISSTEQSQNLPSQASLFESLERMKRNSSSESLPSLGRGRTEAGHATYQAFDEDPTGSLVSRKIFSKLDIESPDHPFFKRVWTVRHVLDENSPLLRAEARHLVRQNNGYWPMQLNNHEGVRSAVLFDQMLVSLSGTSNADANSVYAQKIYEFADVNVGYSFVNQLYRDEDDGSLYVDTRLINDVMEQAGGGGEPLTTERPVKLLSDIWENWSRQMIHLDGTTSDDIEY